MHKVSVIIPVFDGAQHIPNTFRFLSEQTFTDYEIIFVVDAKTTDNTLEVIDGHRPDGKDVKVIMQDDDGRLGEARNIGLAHASGDVIWFFDVDDRPLPDFLSDMLEIMDEHQADTVMCNFVRSSDLNIRVRQKDSYTLWVMDPKQATQARLDEKIPVTAWSRISTRKLLVDNGIEFNHEISEDIEHTFHVLAASNKICYYTRPLYIYYQNKGSICGDSGYDNIRGRAEIEAYKRLERLLGGENAPRAFRRSAALTAIRSAVHMERKNFVEFVKSSEYNGMVKRNFADYPSLEAFFARMMPNLYYLSLKAFLNIVYYRNGKPYTRV